MDTMEQIQEKLGKIQETQALQGQMLSTIMSRMDQYAQQNALQAAQMATIITKVTVIEGDMALYRSDLSGINAWRADTINTFVPRKEHEARRHEERISALEASRSTLASEAKQDAKDAANQHMTLMQWIGSNGITVLLFLVTLAFTIYNALHH